MIDKFEIDLRVQAQAGRALAPDSRATFEAIARYNTYVITTAECPIPAPRRTGESEVVILRSVYTWCTAHDIMRCRNVDCQREQIEMQRKIFKHFQEEENNEAREGT